MKISELLTEAVWKGDARSFGIWLTRLQREKFPDPSKYNSEKVDVYLYDYDDDAQGKPLRYRLLVGRKYLKFIHDVMPEINNAGWHLTVETKLSSARWQLVFEPDMTPRVAKGIFWHVTPEANLASIKETGLIPGTSRHGFKFPQPRIYLFRNEKDCELMRDSLSARDKEPVNYALLRVDLTKAKGVTAHIDPELARVAVYATKPIPPQAIKIIS